VVKTNEGGDSDDTGTQTSSCSASSCSEAGVGRDANNTVVFGGGNIILVGLGCGVGGVVDNEERSGKISGAIALPADGSMSNITLPTDIGVLLRRITRRGGGDANAVDGNTDASGSDGRLRTESGAE